jgi:hypothetical protein
MILQTLRASPELGVFLAVALGYWLGAFKLGAFSLGTVTSALLFGLVVGNFWKEPSADLRSGFFLLFLFANGYSVGPQFVRSLRSGGAKPLLLSVAVCGSGLGAAVVMARILGLDIGLGAGLFSGGMTATPNFPAYPSGHATFGGACFTMLELVRAERPLTRRNPGAIDIEFVSDELNGASIDHGLDDTRPFYPIRYKSIDGLIKDNDLSRVYLGVHWRFDCERGSESGTRIARAIYGAAYHRNGKSDRQGS